MTGFEPRTAGVGSDCSVNLATTTVQCSIFSLYSVEVRLELQEYVINSAMMSLMRYSTHKNFINVLL